METIFTERGVTKNEYMLERAKDRLDQVSWRYDAEWGVDRLPSLVSSDTAAKWATQVGKLRTALAEKNGDLFAELVEGTIRGYAKLAAEALAAGHKPIAPEFWDLRLPESGKVIRMCKNNADAHALAKIGTDEADIGVWTLPEIACVLEKAINRTILNGGKTYVSAPLNDGLGTMYWAEGDTAKMLEMFGMGEG